MFKAKLHQMGEDQTQQQVLGWGGMAVTEGTVTSVSTVEEAEDNELTGVTDWVWC